MALVPKQTSSYNIPASASISRTSISRYGKKQSEGLGDDGSRIQLGCAAHFRANLELAASLENVSGWGQCGCCLCCRRGNALRELGGEKAAASPKEPHHISRNGSTFMHQIAKVPWLLFFCKGFSIYKHNSKKTREAERREKEMPSTT